MLENNFRKLKLVPCCYRFDLPADESIDLEDLERFAKEFKQRRIKLGMLSWPHETN